LTVARQRPQASGVPLGSRRASERLHSDKRGHCPGYAERAADIHRYILVAVTIYRVSLGSGVTGVTRANALGHANRRQASAASRQIEVNEQQWRDGRRSTLRLVRSGSKLFLACTPAFVGDAPDAKTPMNLASLAKYPGQFPMDNGALRVLIQQKLNSHATRCLEGRP
jgi:hypothetical protein